MSGEVRTNSKMTKVVLVGRTGIDAALRADPSLELVRIHETLDAIGEVAFATSSHDNPPVVVIAPEVLDSLRAEKNPSRSELRDFVDALRVANPGVRIVGVSEDGQADAAMDGMLKAPASPESIRRVLFASARVEPPIVEVVRTETRAKAEDADKNAAIFHALLQGKSPLECAMELIRERLGDSSIRFVHETESSSHVRCAVEWSGVLFGYLSSMNTAEREVMPQAKWLAGWIALYEQQNQLREAAFTDHLTGAWNRRYFERYVEAAMLQARRMRQQLTVMIFDIDNFKGYNDKYGHEAGDRILCEIIELLRRVVRPCDRVCRIGGDEFAVVFHDPDGPREAGSTHSVDVQTIAERFRKNVSQHAFPHLADADLGAVGVSGGLATYPWDGFTVEELVRKADELAMRSKASGKNTISFGRGV